VTLNLVEMSVVKSRPSVPYRANFFLLVFLVINTNVGVADVVHAYAHSEEGK